MTGRALAVSQFSAFESPEGLRQHDSSPWLLLAWTMSLLFLTATIEPFWGFQCCFFGWYSCCDVQACLEHRALKHKLTQPSLSRHGVLAFQGCGHVAACMHLSLIVCAWMTVYFVCDTEACAPARALVSRRNDQRKRHQAVQRRPSWNFWIMARALFPWTHLAIWSHSAFTHGTQPCLFRSRTLSFFVRTELARWNHWLVHRAIFLGT